MKTLSIFSLLILLFTHSFSQPLEGRWTGTFNYDKRGSPFINKYIIAPIKLDFVLNIDSSYSVYSFTEGLDSRGGDTTHVCAVFYRRINEDSIYLEEMRLVNPTNVPPICF